MSLALLVVSWFGVHKYMASEITTHFSQTPLKAAAAAVLSQNTDELRQFARRGLNLNQSGIGCETLLSFAIKHKRVQSFETLLQLDANANLSTKDCGDNALYIASVLDDSVYLKTLLDHGGSPNARNVDEAPLTFTASKAFRWENFWVLIGRGADVNAIDSSAGGFRMSGFTLLSSLATIV